MAVTMVSEMGAAVVMGDDSVRFPYICVMDVRMRVCVCVCERGRGDGIGWGFPPRDRRGRRRPQERGVRRVRCRMAFRVVVVGGMCGSAGVFLVLEIGFLCLDSGVPDSCCQLSMPIYLLYIRWAGDGGAREAISN